MKLLTPEQVAVATQLHVVTVRELCRKGEMPGARKFGRVWRISERALEKAMEGEPAEVVSLPSPLTGRSLQAMRGGRWA